MYECDNSAVAQGAPPPKTFPNRGVHGQVCRKVWPKAGDLKAPASNEAHTARLFFAFASMTRTSHRIRAARALSIASFVKSA